MYLYFSSFDEVLIEVFTELTMNMWPVNPSPTSFPPSDVCYVLSAGGWAPNQCLDPTAKHMIHGAAE